MRVAVTGANRGVGLHVCRWLAARGAAVVLLARNEEDGRRARDSLEEPARHRVVGCDLADPGSVRQAAARLLEGPALTALVNNAAVLPSTLRLASSGIELQMAVNHLGHFLLTGLVLPGLERASAGAVVTVTSRSHRGAPLDLDDPDYSRRGYDRLVAYQQSKLANLAFSLALARRLKGSLVASVAVHPGVYATELLGSWTGLGSVVRMGVPGPKEGGRWVGRLVQRAHEAPADVNGTYYEKGVRAEPDPAALDEAAQERLWNWSEEAVGCRFPPGRSGEAPAAE